MAVGQWGVTAFSALSVNEITNRIYVTDNMAEDLNVIDGATNQVTLRPVWTYPGGTTITPATNRVYVSHPNDGTVTIISE